MCTHLPIIILPDIVKNKCKDARCKVNGRITLVWYLVPELEHLKDAKRFFFWLADRYLNAWIAYGSHHITFTASRCYSVHFIMTALREYKASRVY